MPLFLLHDKVHYNDMVQTSKLNSPALQDDVRDRIRSSTKGE